MKKSSLIIMLAGMIWGCTGSIMPKSPPMYYHHLDYAYYSIAPPCPTFQNKIIKVWGFHAISPFDSTEMVVESNKIQILVSKSHQWIDRPGVLLAEWLRKDIDRDGMFSGAYETIETGANLIGMELSGVVERWSWIKTEKGYIASIEVTLTVWKKQPTASILFKKNYKIENKPSSLNTPEAFARAMTELVVKLSQTFRKELYETICAPGN